MFELLLKCNLFKGLTIEDLENLKAKIHYQVKSYNKDELVINAGEQCNSLYIIVEGSVRGEMIDPTGKTIKIEDIDACRPLAPAFLFGKNNTYPVSIISNTGIKVISIPKEMVIKLFQLNETVLTNYLNNIASRTQFLSQKLKFLSFHNIKGKVAHFIIEKSGNILKTIELKENQSELAEFFGVTRPSLARALSEMNKEGSIFAKGKTITILNREKLIKYIK